MKIVNNNILFYPNTAGNHLIHDRQPKSILSCIDAVTGNLDPKSLESYLRFRAKEAQDNILVAIRQAYYSSDSDNEEAFNDDNNGNDEANKWGPPVFKKSRRMKCVMARRLENGEMERILPTESFWYSYYVINPQLDDSRFLAKFRNRFRLPYAQYRELVADCKGNYLFKRWTRCDAIGIESTPIELLVLGSLRYLGRGWTFDDIEESTAVSREVHRVFFHQFIEFGSTVYVYVYV
jgi:hypothetical protein